MNILSNVALLAWKLVVVVGIRFNLELKWTAIDMHFVIWKSYIICLEWFFLITWANLVNWTSWQTEVSASTKLQLHVSIFILSPLHSGVFHIIMNSAKKPNDENVGLFDFHNSFIFFYRFTFELTAKFKTELRYFLQL